MRRTLLIGGWIGIAFLAAATVIVLNLRRSSAPTAAATADNIPAPSLSNTDVALEVRARVVPVQSIELVFPSRGVGEGVLVQEILAQEGAAVKQGDVLARLDNRDLQLRVQAAEGALAQLRADYDQLQATANEIKLKADASIASLQAQADAARLRAAADAAKLRADAAQARAEGRATVAATLEASAASVLESAAVLEADAKANLEKQTAANAAAEAARAANIASAQAKVQQAETALKREQLALELAVMRSPIDGTVIEVNIDVGEVPNIAKPAIIIANLSAWQIEANSLTDLSVANIQQGAPVTITFDALPDLKLSGKVTQIRSTMASSLDQSTPAYTVVVVPDQTDERVRWNMMASLAIGRN